MSTFGTHEYRGIIGWRFRRGRRAVPSKIVWRTRPRSGVPTYGVLRLLLARRAGTTSHSSVRVEHGEVGRLARPRSAGRDGRPTPAIAAGFHDSAAIMSASGMSRWASDTPSDVSSPSIPGGAWSSGCSFVSRACGAWSVAIASIVPSASPARTAATSARRAQRRVDLERRVVAGQQFVGEADVVRCRLGRDREAIGLRRGGRVRRCPPSTGAGSAPGRR